MGTVAFLRNFSVAKHLSKLFDSAHLITIKNISLPLKDNIEVDFIEQHRVFNFDYRNLTSLLSKNNKDIRKKANEKTNSSSIKFLRKILDSFPTNVLFGEGGFLYIMLGTIKGISLVKTHKITHIYSSFRPIADHVIAYNLKLLFPKLNWIADFRDPPIDDNRESVYLKKLQWWFIKKLLSKSNSITTVSDGVNQALPLKNTHTIRNGIYQLFNSVQVEKHNKFTISFTGSIYPDLHKPDVLFSALDTLLENKIINANKFQIVYAGKDSAIWNSWVRKYNIQDLSVDMSEISLLESIKLQHNSHINFLFSWSGRKIKGLLSGKLFEYLATGNPIFSLINGPKDEEFENVFEDLNAGFVFYNDEDNAKISKIISSFYKEWINSGNLDFSYNQEKLYSYSWENSINKFKELL